MFVILYSGAMFNFMTIKFVIMFILYNLLVFSFKNFMDFYQIMSFNATFVIIYIKFIVKHMSFLVSVSYLLYIKKIKPYQWYMVGRREFTLKKNYWIKRFFIK
jgi:hypothetical protein